MSNAELKPVIVSNRQMHHNASRALAEAHVPDTVEIGLSSAIVAVEANEPQVLVVHRSAEKSIEPPAELLPCGPFSPTAHRNLESGVRALVSEQTGVQLGYVEQLYTFIERQRPAATVATEEDADRPLVSICYMALSSPGQRPVQGAGQWRSWYDFFPWEDWRRGRPAVLAEVIEPSLAEWSARAPTAASHSPLDRGERVRISFGVDGSAWDEEKVVERYELLYEAGLLGESARAGREPASLAATAAVLGRPMLHDHRRILATAISRLRSKIKYRPIVFELMDAEFTLFELQRTVEAILGPHLHKQNFRRLVEGAGLVETTGEVRARTGGRPAKLFRFRREVMLERAAPGVRVNPVRN